MPRGVYPNHAKSKRAGRWNDGKIISSHGYSRIRVGKNHPLADPNGYVYEHLLVWVSAGNSKPIRGQIIHHKNEIKTDNRIENLELLSIGKHNELHNQEKDRNQKGQFTAGSLLDGQEWKQFPGVHP